MPRKFKDVYEDSLPDRLPIDVLPHSNEEFIPPDPTPEQRVIMKIASEACTAEARRHGLSRRRFLQTSAAYAICLAAINEVMGKKNGYYAYAHDGCNLNNGDLGSEFPLRHPAAHENRPQGEFVFDLQTHHVDSGGRWRATNPGMEAFFAVVWPQSRMNSDSFPYPGGCGEPDPIECLGRFHYLKELYLDSATDVCVLSAVPFREDGNPLPLAEAAKTCDFVNGFTGPASRRIVMHRFVMPNRGSLGNNSDRFLGAKGVNPVFMQEEFDLMTAAALAHGPGGTNHLRAWKVYTPWGDVPNASGWWLDDPLGIKFIEHALALSDQYGVPPIICAHKGFALPSFDQEKAATKDVGVVAKMFPAMNFIIYHSGYDGGSANPISPPFGQGTSNGPYPGPEDAPSDLRGVDNFITSLIKNQWSARHFAAGDDKHANVPNVYAELGSVWAAVMDIPGAASHVLGKLIYYVGPKRVVWGTDALWGGSPQRLIEGLRTFQMSDEAKLLYHLPWGLDGDVDDPATLAADPKRSIRNGILGRNAAAVYGIDPDATIQTISCDQVQQLRNQYLINPMTPHTVNGPRTRRELFAALRKDPWHRGAVLRMNENGFMKKLV